MTLRDSILGCTDCALHKVGNGPVPPRGVRSSVMIIGEAPGVKEDEKGRPFCGPSGVLLWRELEKLEIDKRLVFTANAVCCYPARTPNEAEIYSCRGNLWRQIRYCDPKWILALGNVANWTLGRGEQTTPMGQLHGKWYEMRFDLQWVKILPTYHPSAVLRDRTLTRAWRDDLRAFAEEVEIET